MVKTFRPYVGPGVVFLIGVALEVSPLQSAWLSGFIFGFAALWLVVTILDSARVASQWPGLLPYMPFLDDHASGAIQPSQRDKPTRPLPQDRPTARELAGHPQNGDSARLAQLTTELDTLKEQLAKKRDEASELDHVRAAFLKQADESPPQANYEPDDGGAWWQGTHRMVQQLAPGAVHKLVGVPFRPKYSDLRQSVTSLRSIAGGLRTEELRKR